MFIHLLSATHVLAAILAFILAGNELRQASNSTSQHTASLLALYGVMLLQPLIPNFSANTDAFIITIEIAICWLVAPLLYSTTTRSMSKTKHSIKQFFCHYALPTTVILLTSLQLFSATVLIPFSLLHKTAHYFWFAYLMACAWQLLPFAISWVGDNSRVSHQQKLALAMLLGSALIWLGKILSNEQSVIAIPALFLFFYLIKQESTKSQLKT